MQRVLSFPPQSNRRFGDPSEFVSKRMCFSFMFSIAFLAVLAGFLLGRFVFDQELELSKAKLRKANQQQLAPGLRPLQPNESSFIGQISSERLQQHLRLLADSSPESLNLHEARLVEASMKEAEFDLVTPLVESTTELSYPDGVNQVLLLQGNDVRLTVNDSRTGPPSSGGLRRSATVTGNVFYVNFGRYDDYNHLDSLGLSVKDSIVLARVGGTPPVDIVSSALDHEAVGIVLYRDPQQKDVESEFLTPADLALVTSYRVFNDDEALPVICITSQDAERLFGEMSTSESSSQSWRGELNSSYPIGPGFVRPDKKLLMKVNTVTIVKTFYDVVGAIRGSQEPDRFVMVTHERTPDETGRESTAIVMEMTKAFGVLRKTNDWRPYRSIVVASWGTDNHYSFRSEKWWSQLRKEAVAYLKIESALLGNDSASSRGSLMLERVFRESIADIFPSDPQLDPMLLTREDMGLVRNGIPFLQLKQHSLDKMEEVTSFWGRVTWRLSESIGLPFTLDPYANFLNHSIAVIQKRFQFLSQKHKLFLESFYEATQRLTAAISSFQSKWSFAESSKSVDMRMMNDQFLTFSQALSCERSKIDPQLTIRHMIFSRSNGGQDSKAGFGFLQDLLRETTWTEAPDDLREQIINHLAELVECINEARYALTDGLEKFVATE